jgi:release factor glutamine methyltransferase
LRGARASSSRIGMTAVAALLAQAARELDGMSDSPRLDAEALLAHVTGKNRAHFRAWPEKEFGAAEEAEFRLLMEKRLAGQPIAYLVGEREFWSRPFKVTPDALIPRPETELLVELALQRIAADRPARIADLGAGSGAVAVTLALELPHSEVVALDISPAALAVARDNARRLGAANARFLQSDWFAALPPFERFDIIVSNPPYIAEGDSHLEQGDVRFEPRLALIAGIDGLDAIRRIVREAPSRLHPGGWLLFEHGHDQAERARGSLREAGFGEVESCKDLQGIERVSGGRI